MVISCVMEKRAQLWLQTCVNTWTIAIKKAPVAVMANACAMQDTTEQTAQLR